MPEENCNEKEDIPKKETENEGKEVPVSIIKTDPPHEVSAKPEKETEESTGAELVEENDEPESRVEQKKEEGAQKANETQQKQGKKKKKRNRKDRK
ncbi:hypothetical protein XELAEV_18005028mg [Xenopus laevis]|uniref:Uncharacterized protein n=1 Tax=Xenopus laevis TaxID=8355 RepID=A0A974I2Z4_XENLA|nr:hypothetical protein XELAEV_18005028mg [Xenopus laevis]